MERLKKEQEVNVHTKKEKAEALLYTIIKVARDEDLTEQIGKDIYFDLVDHDKVQSFRVQKQISFNVFKEEVAKEFGVPVQFQRYWLWAKRQNHTYRPIRPLTHIEEAQSVGQLREVSKKVHNAELKLFLEVELGLDLRPIAPPDKTKDDILLFFKLYDPEKEELRYVGRLLVNCTGKPSEILTRLNEMAGYDPDEEIGLYEEIKFEPNVMCEPIDKQLTFRASQLGDGDIVCFQKAPVMDIEELVRYPDVPSYLEYVHNHKVVHFRSPDKPKEDNFCLEMSMLDTYDDVVVSVAQQLGLDDPSKIRLTPHNCSSQQPKPQPIKYRGVKHLSDMLVHYDQTSYILYYEVLDIPLQELQCLKTLKVAFHHATKDEVVIHTIRLPKQSTVGDVLDYLKTKMELSHPDAELRLLEVFYHKIYKVFPPNEKIENINDQYWTLRAEEIPEEEKNLGPHDRLIHVYHFTKDTAQNQMQIQNFGEPFFLVIREGEALAEIKVRIQKKLQVPDDEFAKWKFAFFSLGRPEYLQDSDIVSSRFQRSDAYGAWEQYLGLEHTGNTPKRAYAVNQKLHMGTEKKHPAILFQPSNSANPFASPGVRYSSEKMREIIATAVMVHEQPLSIVDDEVWLWAFQYANLGFQKVTCETVRGDCLAIYEAEKKKLKALLKNVSKISLTTDVWKSSHQVDEYMVIFGHFVDAGWKLQKKVLSFVKMSAPRYRIDVGGAIFKCLKAWEIENKVFLAVDDNTSYNDSCLRNLKVFHVSCYAHILNLLVQDGLSKINDIIYNVRESVRYISYSESRLKAFYDVVEQKHLKDGKLIIDCQTRWTSTFQMLSAALKFKIAFLAYMEIEPQYDFAPTHEDWEKVEKLCQLLKEINNATHIISDSEYPTASLYLAEVWRLKEVIDNAAEDKDLFMREMASPMKVKFDKYLEECNLLIAIASVFDPRCKFHIVDICFPLIYKSEEVAKDNIKKVRTSLQELYEECASLNIEESSCGEVNICGNNSPSSSAPKPSIITGFDQIMSLVREKKVVPTVKSELDVYLEEGVYIPDDDNISFSALEWWRNNSLKFKILSKLAADILAIPFSTVVSEYPRGRVIDEFHSKLDEESIEALICGGDWLRHKYGLKRKL